MQPTRTLLSIGALAVLGAIVTPSLAAQSAQRFSIQASGLFVGTYGEAYEGMNGGQGLEAQLRYTPSVWSFGLGFQRSSHSFDDTGLGGEDVVLSGVFFEPRRVMDVGSTAYAPYLSARLAVLRESVDIEYQGQPYSAEASGTQLNLGGGVLLRVSPRVNVDLGATVGLINFGDVELTVPGVGTANIGEGGTGQNVVMRAGLAIGL